MSLDPEILAGDWAGALRAVAERLVYSRLQKSADARSDAAYAAQAARRELGSLGADDAQINEGVRGVRSGKDSDAVAASKVQRAVPNRLSQFGDALLGRGFGTALGQGEVGLAAKHLDVPGIKNVIPGSGNFSPTTLLASGAAAGLGHGLRSGAFENLARRHIGRIPGSVAGRVGGWLEGRYNKRLGDFLLNSANLPHFSGAGKRPTMDTTLRQQHDENRVNWENIKGTGRGTGWHVLPHNQNEKIPQAKVKGQPLGQPLLPTSIPRSTVENAMRTAGPPKRTWGQSVGDWGVPAAAALLPALAREWLGGGFRSGRGPAMALAKANRTLYAGR